MAVTFLRLQVGGFVGLIIASVIGGVAFHFLESDNEVLQRNNAAVQLANFLASHTCVNLTQIKAVSNLVNLAKAGGVRIAPPTQTNPIVENFTNWDIQNTVFLSFQAVGSVGFGNTGPATVSGKVFLVFYIICGIPLFFVTAYGIGEVLANWSDHVRLFFYRRVLHREPLCRTTTHAGICNTIGLFSFGFPIFIIVPSVVFYSLEDWTYGESLYSTILATLTIGFTDFQPGANAPASYRGVYRILVGVWLIVDLFWFAGVLQSLRCVFKLEEKAVKPIDEAIREENAHGKNGQKKLRVKKNWKQKHFDRHFQQNLHQQQQQQPIGGGLVSHVDVVPVYNSAGPYPDVINDVTDPRLTVPNPITSQGNVSRLMVGGQ